LSFLVSRPSSESAFTTDFDVVLSGATATAGVDFVAGGGSYQFKPGESDKFVDVDNVGDTDMEPNDTVVAQLANVAWGEIGDGTATGTIGNDDGAVLEVVDVTAPEGQAGDSTATVTVALTEPSATPVTFDFATADDTAAAGVDYVAASGSRTIPAGQLGATFPVTLKGDTANEGDEALFVDIGNASVSVLRDRGTVEIANDDGGLSVADVTVTEGNAGLKTATFVVQMANPAPVPVSFDVRAVAGTATASDFLPSWQALTIPAGMTSKVFTVAIKGDTVGEADETFVVQLSNAVNTNIADGTGIGTIANDDVPSISLADVTVNEGDGGTKLMTFTASLSAVAGTPVTFSAKSTDNTASAGSDYVALDATGLSIPAGQLARTFTVTIKGDTTVEPTEYFRVDLASVVGATIADGRGVGYIVNNDGARLVVNNVAVAEGNAGQKALTFTVSLTQAAPGPVTYNIATSNGTAAAGSDYVALNLTGQVIPAGELSKTHTVLVNGDTAIEDTEAFAINVRQPTGASVWDGQGIGYVLNDDSAALFVPDAGVVEGNSGTKVINVTVKLTEAAPGPVSYTLTTSNGSALAGSDYAALSLADQVIPAGQLQKVHQVVVNGDTDVEANESLNITLSNASGATVLDAKALGFIYNDDGPTLTVGDAAISEGQSGTKVLTFTVTLSQAQGTPVTYDIATSNLTATAGSDYVASARAGETIPAGQLSRTFAVTLNGDSTVEPNETFRVTLSNPTVGVSLLRPVATGTINNDD
jgi:chitinase